MPYTAALKVLNSTLHLQVVKPRYPDFRCGGRAENRTTENPLQAKVDEGGWGIYTQRLHSRRFQPRMNTNIFIVGYNPFVLSLFDAICSYWCSFVAEILYFYFREG